MADTDSKAKPKSESSDSERRYTVERLMADCDVFTGHPAHVLAGALHGDDRKELTAADAKKAIRSWLGKEG